jgi:4-amino-4-deoxy-L-arabinose transferase-like glycosyltransferase
MRITRAVEGLSQRTVLTTLVVLGLVLRVWQYAANPSLWYDEISIARNLTERSLGDLVSGPLFYTQIAPVGWIALTKLATLALGTSDYALRFVPFVCGVAALLLFRRLAERTLDGTTAIIAVALFACAPPLIRYTTELKQYGLDLAITVALTLVALDLRRPVAAGLFGFLIIWFSQASILVMAGLGAALLVIKGRQALVTVALWAVACVVGLVVARHYATPETLAFMHRFWGARHGFVSWPPRLWSATQFFGETWMLAYPWPLFYTAATVIGFVLLWRQRRDVALLLVGPLVATVLASIAQQYPFHTRVIVFLLPSVIIALAVAIASVRFPILVAALLVGPLYAIVRRPPPYVIEPYKPVFAYFREHRQAADQVYVFANTSEAAEYYGPRYGLTPDMYYVGICDRFDNRSYLTDLDRFRGVPRLWILSSGVPPYAPARRTIAAYLGTIGVRSDSLVLPSFSLLPVSADLYTLDDTVRLRSGRAATFPVDAIPDTLRPGCRNLRQPKRPTETSR